MNSRFFRILVGTSFYLTMVLFINGLTVQAKQNTIVQISDFSLSEQSYRNHCMACHGANLEGGLGPNLQHVGSRLSKQAIITKITFGVGQMPPFGGQLSPLVIQLLGEWLSEKK